MQILKLLTIMKYIELVLSGSLILHLSLHGRQLQEILKLHGVDDASTGSPREILQLGYKFGFINDSAVWLMTLKKRNSSMHIYNEDEVDELILLIMGSFIPAFAVLQETLENKLREAESDWE